MDDRLMIDQAGQVALISTAMAWLISFCRRFAPCWVQIFHAEGTDRT